LQERSLVEKVQNKMEIKAKKDKHQKREREE
jgi:hypothetical protein